MSKLIILNQTKLSGIYEIALKKEEETMQFYIDMVCKKLKTRMKECKSGFKSIK